VSGSHSHAHTNNPQSHPNLIHMAGESGGRKSGTSLCQAGIEAHLVIRIPLTPFLGGERGGREGGEGVVGGQLLFGFLFPRVHLIMTVAEQSDRCSGAAICILSSLHMGPYARRSRLHSREIGGVGLEKALQVLTVIDDAKRNAPACMHSLPSYAGLALELQASAQSVAASSCRQSVDKSSSLPRGLSATPALAQRNKVEQTEEHYIIAIIIIYICRAWS